MATYEVDPISRIEGHLGVKITESGGTITQANVHGNLWRGFENFLIGRDPNDAITFTQRICGVCPIPHGTTALFNVESVYGYNDCFQTFGAAPMLALSSTDGTTSAVNAKTGVPAKALYIRNLVLAAEFVMSHLTHLYHLVAPSYIQGPNIPPWTPYFGDTYYNVALRATDTYGTGSLTGSGDYSGNTSLPANAFDVSGNSTFAKDVWSAVIRQYVKALRIRRLTFEAGAVFAGRMPMTSAWVAGGVTTDHTEDLTDKCELFYNLFTEIGKFCVKEFVPTFLVLGALYLPYDNSGNGGSKFGDNSGNFLSWGGFPEADGTLFMKRGYKVASGAYTAITKANVYDFLREDIKYSRYVSHAGTDMSGNALAADVTLPATEMTTEPIRSDVNKYSWLKAPRWNGNAMEVGPFARMAVAGTYPINNTKFTDCATVIPHLGLSMGTVYGLYTASSVDVSGNVGLDPAMIEADIAVALVRAGLATLYTSVDNGATRIIVNSGNINTLKRATIIAGYQFANPAGVAIRKAVIMGTVRDWVVNLKGGISTMDRLRARALESILIVTRMIGVFSKSNTDVSWPAFAACSATSWIGELKAIAADTTKQTFSYVAAPTGRVQGFGATEAPRGALMHMCTIDAGRIVQYQCIVPTTWNASPKDAAGKCGPMEHAIIGAPYATGAGYGGNFKTIAGAWTATQGGVEALRIAQSFDPCIACAVH